MRHARRIIDLDADARFIAARARLIDRRRFEHLEGAGSTGSVLRALTADRLDLPAVAR